MDKLLKLCHIFDCSLDELVTGDLTGRQVNTAASDNTAASANTASTNTAEPAGAVEPTRPAEPTRAEDSVHLDVAASRCVNAPADLYGYEAHMQRMAWCIPTGIACVILGLALSLLIGPSGHLGPASMASLQAVALLMGLFVGLGFIIPVSIADAAFKREHHDIPDFYTAEQKREARTQFTGFLIAGITLVFGVLLVVIFNTGSEFGNRAGAAGMFGFFAGAVWCFVHGLMLQSRINIVRKKIGMYSFVGDDGYSYAASDAGERNYENPDDIRQNSSAHETTKQRRQHVRNIRKIIMIVATILGLLLLFCGGWISKETGIHINAFPFFLCWPIGALCCELVAPLMDLFYREK